MAEVYTIANKTLKFSASVLGAEPKSLVTGKREWLVQPENEDGTGFSPVLFPIIGNLPDDKHVVDGKTYPMPMHGFAKNSVFDVAEKTDSSISFVLNSDDEIMKMYPYKFKFSVTYSVEDNRLITEYRVVNDGDSRMHYAIGSHTGFCLNTDKENYTMIFERNMENREDVSLYNACDEFKFEDNRLDIKDVFFENGCVVIGTNKSKTWQFVNKTDNSIISYTSDDFPYLTLWSIPGQPFICLESWSFISCHFCKGESFSELPEICTLDAGADVTFKYVLSFSENKI